MDGSDFVRAEQTACAHDELAKKAQVFLQRFVAAKAAAPESSTWLGLASLLCSTRSVDPERWQLLRRFGEDVLKSANWMQQ